MSDINISLLRADVLDRLDNSVIGQQVPEPLRQKLISKKRVTRALNQALILFLRDADPATVQKFQQKVDLVADTEVGTNGVVNNVTTYNWPVEAFTARADGGLIKIILNDAEKYFDPSNNTLIESVRSQANNTLYGSGQAVFHVDLVGKRIYVPSDVTASVRVITEPEVINDDDEYGEVVAPDPVIEEIPISDTFAQTLSELAIQELIKATQNYANRQRVVSDTANQAAPPQQDN